ncbi:hypothetical protein DI396_15805 [Litorivita pollutaquae]|uniref:Integrase catalytic domain-containing protein n=1 Tax=Litorivita pollutaquae TaxID=2200892 RepID=A0A2V4MQK0_9RHOB|nr:hypothetical protein DI396_15805 [Litorivita pollutaquae]
MYCDDGGRDRKKNGFAPGKLMQNGFVESINGVMRDERLNENLFDNLRQARQLIAPI